MEKPLPNRDPIKPPHHPLHFRGTLMELYIRISALNQYVHNVLAHNICMGHKRDTLSLKKDATTPELNGYWWTRGERGWTAGSRLWKVGRWLLEVGCQLLEVRCWLMEVAVSNTVSVGHTATSRYRLQLPLQTTTPWKASSAGVAPRKEHTRERWWHSVKKTHWLPLFLHHCD